MKYVKWIFVVLLIGSLTSFVEKDKPTGGLNVGDIAPDFKIQSMSAGQPLALHRERRENRPVAGMGKDYLHFFLARVQEMR